MIDIQECFEKVLEYSAFLHINAIYFNTRGYLGRNGIDDDEEYKIWFIKMLKMILEQKKAIIVFDSSVVDEEKKRELDNADMQAQLDFIYNSFPTEYDENIMEKDIDNLWWYCCCPVEIGWLREDGSYYFS